MSEPPPPDAGLVQAAYRRAGFVEADRPVTPGPTPQSVVVGAPPPQMRSVLQVVRPDGVTTFHLPARTVPAAGIVGAGTGALVFQLPDDVLAPSGAPDTGLPAAPAPTVTVLDVGLGELVGDSFAATYAAAERVRHPYVLRRVGGGTELFAGPDAGDAAAFAGRRVLVFVHGIFSTCQNAFGALPAAVVQRLSAGYDVVLAFDHPTVSVDPGDNVAWLLDRLRGAGGAVLDVVTHSRGGLVARALAAALRPGQIAEKSTSESIASSRGINDFFEGVRWRTKVRSIRAK